MTTNLMRFNGVFTLGIGVFISILTSSLPKDLSTAIGRVDEPD